MAILLPNYWATLCCIMKIYRIEDVCDKRCEEVGAALSEIGAETTNDTIDRRSTTAAVVRVLESREPLDTCFRARWGSDGPRIG